MPLHELLGIFPRLPGSNPIITSPPTFDYNCVAWVVGDTTHWWEPFGTIIPAPPPEYYWPPHLPNDTSVGTYSLFLADHGFEPCADGTLEPDLEKVAIFSREGRFTHAAKQLANGRWSSKAGVAEDLEHELCALGGTDHQFSFGEPTHYYRRPRPVP